MQVDHGHVFWCTVFVQGGVVQISADANDAVAAFVAAMWAWYCAAFCTNVGRKITDLEPNTASKKEPLFVDGVDVAVAELPYSLGGRALNGELEGSKRRFDARWESRWLVHTIVQTVIVM